MKYIKRFNEELKPQTYMQAGYRLKNLPGGGKRSTPLIDYGLEKQYGFYNMHWTNSHSNSSTVIADSAKFTNPKCECYFGRPDSSKIETFRYSAEDAVELWKQGSGPLCMTFNFTFQPAEETKDKFPNSSEINTSNLPMFEFQVWFSNWEEGLDAYNWDYDTEEPMTGDAVVDVSGMYKWTNEVVIYKSKPERMYYGKQYPYYGIFSDRQSALKFKRQLNDLILPHKEKVMELLSCVNANADAIDEFEDKINKISVNALFSVGFDKSDQANWFREI
jgi:hypothetical protein